MPAADSGARLDGDTALQLISQLHHVVFRTDLDGRVTYCNDAWYTLTGYTVSETLGRISIDLVVPEDRPRFRTLRAAIFAGDREARTTTRILHRDGHTLMVEAMAQPLYAPDGTIAGTFGTLIDISEQRRVTAELRAGEAHFRTLVESGGDFVARFAPDGRLSYISPASAAFIGLPIEEIIGKHVHELPGATELLTVMNDAIDATRRSLTTVHRLLDIDTPQGTVHFDWRLIPEFAPDGSLLGIISSARDVTPLIEAEEALRRRESREQRFERALLALHEIRNELNKADTLESLCRDAVLLGTRHFDFDRLSIWLATESTMIRGTYGIDEHGALRDERHVRLAVSPGSVMGRVLYERERLAFEQDGAIHNHLADRIGAGAHIIAAIWDGEEVSGALSMDNLLTRRPVDDFDGELLELYATTIGHHITQWRAEDARRRGEEQYRHLFNTMSEGFAVHEMLYDESGYPLDYRFLEINPAFEAQTGLRKDDVIGRTVREIIPDIETFWITRYGEVAQTGRSITFMNYSAPLDRHFEVVAFSPEAGKFATLFLDVTERIRSEEERVQLEDQLRQAQKMEAVGRLAGGIAHDFNNLLSPILGYADLLLLDPLLPSAAHEQVTRIRDAAQRAASLTRQMLAFSRKQVLEMRPLDLGAVVGDFVPMLQKLIGEDILLTLSIAPSLWPVEGDTTQLQQILMNLAINARDAMPHGGKLRLSLHNATVQGEPSYVHPGDYVQLTVTDTGVGMDAATQERIFEPFFTTKEVGRGTGLGMSTVYGIVQQHRGGIAVDSQTGVGTTVTVWLPRGAEMPVMEAARLHPALLPAPAQTTILLVEDDDMVRALAEEQLAGRGYHVLTAADGPRALALVRNSAAEITLLVTDVIMPGMNGKELYEALCPLRPGLRVVYISGYSDDILGHQGVLTPGTHFIAKPFTLHSFLRVVEAALG
jgi:PAS domain S-box-containing protein